MQAGLYLEVAAAVHIGMHQGTEFHQTLPHLLVALSEESKMRPRGDKGQRYLYHCPYFTLGSFVSKEDEFSVEQRQLNPHSTSSGRAQIDPHSGHVLPHHVLVPEPLMCR